MERDIRRLGRLIDDIQAATRLDRALGDGPGMRFDPAKLLADIIDIRRARAQLDGVGLLLEGASHGRQILGRGEQLGHALGNIIDNALSFSKKGDVIRVTLRDQDKGLLILIDDDGPGIPEDQRERVFERFYSSRPGEKGHSGLGLPIARQIIRRHGGDINLHGSPTGGLRVHVFLPWGEQ
jgi:Signal transduction histidine kinase